MARNLNRQLFVAMSALTLLASLAMYFGYVFYYTFIFDLIYSATDDTEKLNAGDFIVFGLIVAIGLVAAAAVGWLMAQSIIRPLKSIAVAAHSIANGDFSVRAKNTEMAFSEAESLIADFNTMAARLESAEAELRYSSSAIAHELRTPLTILRGRLQGLSDGAYKPSPELYGRLIAHVDDLARIVEDLRTLGLSSVGKLELKLDEIDLALEARAVATSMEQGLASAGITVKCDLGKAVVLADQARIRQAILAVLDNARRYAPGSVVAVETRTTKDRALIRCSDDGPGLPAGTQKRVFERFWRGDDSRARASGGSGLGLPIVKAIANAHGGDAVVTDNGGTGVAIEIWLPKTMPV